MGCQVIKQPDGKLAVFSSSTDTWVLFDGTPEEVVDWFVERAAQWERQRVQPMVDAVLADQPERAYYQFVRTFARANATSKEHGGVVWEDDKGWPEGDLS